MTGTRGLVVIDTHPVQYRAPVYRALQLMHGIPVTVIYGSDFSVAGYHDREFGTAFAWDTDLLSGYRSVFLSRVAQGGSRSFESISARGLGQSLRHAGPGPLLLAGYSPRFHQDAVVQAWRSHRPILFRADTADHTRRRGMLQELTRDQLLRWFYATCTKVLYVGHHSAQHFRRLGVPESKLVFSPFCVDTAPFQIDEPGRARLRSAIRLDLNVDADRVVLLFSGKLTAAKGVDLLLSAVKALPAAIGDKVVVAFLGSGEMRRVLEARAATTPSIKVRFCGFKNQTALSPYYHAADLLVLPSYGETWGLVVNEALHHGLPCVVSESVGCAPDLIEPGVTGEIAETGSVASLAGALLRGLNLAGRADIRRRCRDRVSRYTVAKAADGIAQAYRDLFN